jgi:glycosyltransferase involved in cell wall biosynthesis
MQCEVYDRDRLPARMLADTDVVVGRPPWPLVMRTLRRSGARLIFDLYYPDTLERLEQTSEAPGTKRKLWIRMITDKFNEAMRVGHHFICASEVQRDLWLGAMLSQGLIRPQVYDRDPSLRSVIDAVPFGVPDDPPKPGSWPWEKFPGIGDEDEVVVWNGGIWGWLDAPTAIRAIAELGKRRPQVRLVFMAGRVDRLSSRAIEEARSLAAELKVLDRLVFINDTWVPYEERGAALLAANAAILCQRPVLETTFAFRTRVIDCFWAGLPVVITEGDMLADVIERDDLGAVAPQADPAGVASALEQVLERGRRSYAPALERAADRYRWSNVGEPLVRLANSAGPVPRLGDGVPRRAGQQLRTAAYSAVFGPLGAVRSRSGSAVKD